MATAARAEAAGTSLDAVLAALERMPVGVAADAETALRSLRASVRATLVPSPAPSPTATAAPAASSAAAPMEVDSPASGMTLRSRTLSSSAPSPPPSPADAVVVPILPPHLYYTEIGRQQLLTPADVEIWLPLEPSLHYINFANDFGPVNLARLYRFCITMHSVLQAVQRRPQYRLVCFSRAGSAAYAARANGAFVLSAYMMLYQQQTPQAAFAPFQQAGLTFVPYCDAGGLVSLFHLTVSDCLEGLRKAVALGWINLATFDVADYEFHEQVENGDWNWIVPGKFLAFAGPQGFDASSTDLAPSFYIPHFKRMGITTVVRLNNVCYDAEDFRKAGIAHHELYFPDGHNPPDDVLDKFLDLARHAQGAIAVHCKAGLGRTGTLICAYIMRYHGFTAAEAIGFCRICRPGSVVGPQQTYLASMEPYLQGRSPSPSPTSSPTPATGGVLARQPRKTRDGRSITVQITDQL